MSFSDFYASDLTDITSSSEEEEQPYLPKVKKLSVKKPKIDHWSAYNVTNPLRPPRSTNYSVRSLYGIFQPFLSSFLFLRFQSKSSMALLIWTQTINEVLFEFPARPLAYTPPDVVWSEQKQIGLIDSVFRNYYIPPIIFGLPFISRHRFSSRSHLPPSCLYVERW
jgi:hypothetical protein